MVNDFINIFIPQGCLIVFIFLQTILSFIMSKRYYKYASLISLIGISLTIILLSTVHTEPQYFGFKNSVMSDYYTLLFHFIILLSAFFVLLLTKKLLHKIKEKAYVFNAIYLTAILGGMNIVSANDFLTLFVSIELFSFSTYFLISTAKGYYSKEAAFKYLITNAVASGVFLFGVSYLYGLSSSFNFSQVYQDMTGREPSVLVAFSGIMIMLGIISKLAIFPFANWVIDVFKGCETSILAFLSTIPKIAFFGIICRFLVFTLESNLQLTFVLAILSIVTAFWANIFAIKESNVKAVFACSSSANASYILLTASLVSVYNIAAVIFYLICYVIMDLVVFAYLNITERNNIGLNIENFRGLFYKNKMLTSSYAISIIALAGFPITSGFIAKIYLFSAIANSGILFIPFLLILLLLTVVALFYYIKLLYPLFENYDKNIFVKKLKVFYSQRFVIIICTAITVFIGICPSKLIELCKFIAYNI